MYNANLTADLKVNDKVHVFRHGHYRTSYSAGVVVKKTPTGIVDILVDNADKPTRYCADGRERGGSGYYRTGIDAMPFEERVAQLDKDERRAEAAHAIRDIVATQGVNPMGDNGSLGRELDRLQAAVDAARQLLAEAI